MPRRPPKKWMRDCIAGVEEKGGRGGRPVKDPGAVCGSLWHHKMGSKAKKEALARERATGRKTGRKTGKKTGKKTGRKTSGHARATRGMRAGYYALDARGRIVSGPHPSQWQARGDANRSGGWVQYEPGPRRTR